MTKICLMTFVCSCLKRFKKMTEHALSLLLIIQSYIHSGLEAYSGDD